MVRRSSRLSLSLVVAALAGSASPALADSLPRLPGVIHLNPFIPGWFPLGPPRNIVVPPGGVDIQPGADGLVSPFGWAWEMEFDWLGLAGIVIVSVNGSPPVPMLFGPGPDQYIVVFQADAPEVGAFNKTFVNQAFVPIAWGTSVVELPGPGSQNVVLYTMPNGTTGELAIGPVPTGAQRPYISYRAGVYHVDFTQQQQPCPGDANGDRRVDFADLNAVLSQFGQQGPGLAGDVNGDGAVNFQDLNMVLANFGRPC